MEQFDRKTDRVLYIDALRTFAALAVIVLHAAAQNWRSLDAASFEWQVFNVFDSMVRWCVPVFVMISGALFLDRENSLEKIFKKYILRIVTAYLFWSILYALVGYVQGWDIKKAVKNAIQGHYHMWYLLMVVGLYLIIPFVKKITESMELVKYFLLLTFLFTLLIPQSINMITLYNKNMGSFIKTVWADVNFHFTLGYVGYFVLGYFLSKRELSKKLRACIYISSFIGFAGTIWLTSFFSSYAGKPVSTFYGYLNVNVMLESLGVFVFFKYDIRKFKLTAKIEKILAKLSKYSFGVYLVHPMIMEQLNKQLGINTLSFHPVVSIIVLALIMTIGSFAVSYICNHIPKLNKYIV